MPMTFQAVVALVMISGPSDTDEEVEAVKATIAKWNSNHAKEEGVVFVPQHYSTDVVPVLRAGVDGQAIINEQITNHADVILALFKYRLGTPTPRSEHSGTVEEAETLSETGMAHMFFWRGSSLPMEVDANPAKRAQWDKLNAYRETFRKNTSGLYFHYDSISTLVTKVESTLWMDARILKARLGTFESSPTAPTPAVTTPKLDLDISLGYSEVWHFPELPELVESLIRHEVAFEERRAEKFSDIESGVWPYSPIDEDPRRKSAVEVERWTSRTQAKLQFFDKKIAAATGSRVFVELSTKKNFKDLEIDLVFSNVRGLDATADSFLDIWTPLGTKDVWDGVWGEENTWLLGRSRYSRPRSEEVAWYSSWKSIGDDVVLTVSVPRIHKNHYRSEPIVVLMIPFNETGVDEIQYSWRATAANMEGEVEGKGIVPVMDLPPEQVIEWIKSDYDRIF